MTLVLVFVRGAVAGAGVGSPPSGPEEDLTVPGARIEPSDDFAVEGGAGGAEGEGGSPGYDDGADGGVGGAEGGAYGISVRRPVATWSAFCAAFVAGFGALGWAARGAGDALPIPSWALGIVGGAVLGGLACAAIRSGGR